jgi:hypothetical protein
VRRHEDKVSLINEPLAAPDGTTALPVAQRPKPLHAQLCEVLLHTKELLMRLEARGVYVPRDGSAGGGTSTLCRDQESGEGAGGLLGV